MKIKRILGFSNSEKGFTLIEIIAVLVILGILAAVAIPKYVSLQQSARSMSARAGVNELIARANSAFALEVSLRASNGGNVSNITTSNLSVDNTGLGDYTGTWTSSNGFIAITKVQGTAVTDVNYTWVVPSF